MERSARLTDNQIKELKSFLKDKSHSQKKTRRAQAILLLDQSIDLKVIQMTTGYSWTIIHLKNRKIYLDALEKTSIQGDITDFTRLIVREFEKA